MKRILLILTILTILTACKQSPENQPVQVIFDHDMGNDVDDLLALQMLLTYRQQGKVDLICFTDVKANDYSIKFTDAYLRYNKINDIDLGYVYQGPNPMPGRYAKKMMDTLIYKRPVIESALIVDKSILPEAYKLLRKKLSEADDKSIVLIAVGPLTNIKRLLDSKPDGYSQFDGIELVKKKVKKVSIMGGRFPEKDKNKSDWNFKQDIEAAKTVLEKCPSPIILSSREIGFALPYPYESLKKKFASDHPLRMSYELYEKMPHDRPCFYLTSVLCAVEDIEEYFILSPHGAIKIDENGIIHFEESANGLHQYLILDPYKKDKILDRLVELVSFKTEVK